MLDRSGSYRRIQSKGVKKKVLTRSAKVLNVKTAKNEKKASELRFKLPSRTAFTIWKLETSPAMTEKYKAKRRKKKNILGC